MNKKNETRKVNLLRRDLEKKGFVGIISLKSLDVALDNEAIEEFQIINNSSYEIKYVKKTQQVKLIINMANVEMDAVLLERLTILNTLTYAINQVDFDKDSKKVTATSKKGEIKNILSAAEVIYMFAKSNLSQKIELLRKGDSIKVGVITYQIDK